MVKQLSGPQQKPVCISCLHTHTHTLIIAPPELTSLFSFWGGGGLCSLQGCSEEPSGNRGRALGRTMKTEDSLNQSRSGAEAPRRTSGSNYGAGGRRITAASRPPVPLLGLMLLLALPLGASIKQSVPRVKLSHRGKSEGSKRNSGHVVVF